MYSRQNIPAPFQRKPCQPAVPAAEKTIQNHAAPSPKKGNSFFPFAALLFLNFLSDLFSDRKKG